MKIIYNNIIPLRGYDAMCIYPFIFVRNDRRQYFTKKTETHECIHAYQQIETCVLFLLVLLLLAGVGLISFWWLLASPLAFFVLYALEYIVKGLFYLPFHKSKADPQSTSVYLKVSFEREAYANEGDAGYPDSRKPFAWLHYLFRPE